MGYNEDLKEKYNTVKQGFIKIKCEQMQEEFARIELNPYFDSIEIIKHFKNVQKYLCENAMDKEEICCEIEYLLKNILNCQKILLENQQETVNALFEVKETIFKVKDLTKKQHAMQYFLAKLEFMANEEFDEVAPASLDIYSQMVDNNLKKEIDGFLDEVEINYESMLNVINSSDNFFNILDECEFSSEKIYAMQEEIDDKFNKFSNMEVGIFELCDDFILEYEENEPSALVC